MVAFATVLGVVSVMVLVVAGFLFSQPGFKMKRIAQLVGGCTVAGGVVGCCAFGSELACVLGTELGFLGGIALIFALAWSGKQGPM